MISTVCDLFAPDALSGFGQRAARARPFWALVDLDVSRSDTPLIALPDYPPEPWPDGPAVVDATPVAPPANTAPLRTDLTGGDLVPQLQALVPKLHALLDAK